MQKSESSNIQLAETVKKSINKYFENLDGTEANNLYNLLIAQIEAPLLETVMTQADQNQSKAALWLGISRNTLRKLLSKHQILS